MKPGEKRILRALIAGTTEVGDIELTALEPEPTEMLDGSRELLLEIAERAPGTRAVRGVKAAFTPEHGRSK